MSKYQRLEEAGVSYKQKFIFVDTVGQNMSQNKVKKWRKVLQKQKTLVSVFGKFLIFMY